jgi:hypothetical protein
VNGRHLVIVLGLGVPYLFVLAVVLGGLARARDHIVTRLSVPEQRADWQEWKAETERESGKQYPVERRAVKSNEPPSLVLMRDYFPAVLAVSLLAASFFYAFAAFIGYGALRQWRRVVDRNHSR